MNEKDALGNRMKKYENVNRYKLVPRTYTLCRVDGKNFSTYTKGLQKPFDEGLIEDMNNTAIYLCQNVMGCKLAYVQSDEITLILTDFDKLDTDAWFDRNLQKMCSVSASYATAKFNQLRVNRELSEKWDEDKYSLDDLLDDVVSKYKLAHFDSRVFQIPFIEEVINCLIWRQQDATRNSIQSVAQTYFPAKQLHNKDVNELQEMLFQKGVNWNDFETGKKRGRLIVKVEQVSPNTFNYPEHLKKFEKHTEYVRKKWEVIETPIFSSVEGKELLRNILTPKEQ